MATTISVPYSLMLQKESGLKILKAQLQSLQNKPETQAQMPYIWSQWKFDIKHIKGKYNFLPDLLSRTKRQIWTIIPMIYALCPENPAESLREMISMMPQGLQAKMLDLVLVYKGLETVHGFLNLYIHMYGLDQGPLLRLPYHLVHPFLTIIEANPTYYCTFLYIWCLPLSSIVIGTYINQSHNALKPILFLLVV